MPIRKKWMKFDLENISKVPKVAGAYELANSNKTQIDDGGSNTSLQRRLREKKAMYPTATYFRYDTPRLFQTGFELEAEHSHKYQSKHGNRPKKNKRSPTLSIFSPLNDPFKL